MALSTTVEWEYAEGIISEVQCVQNADRGSRYGSRYGTREQGNEQADQQSLCQDEKPIPAQVRVVVMVLKVCAAQQKLRQLEHT